MKATEAKRMEFLRKSPQFVIPIYQRTYSWTEKECCQLWDDIIRTGRDDRAREHQPVRECFGPRFYDWQLAQSAEESWRECHLHARNLLGADGYQALLDGLEGKEVTGGNVVVGGRCSVDGKQNTTPATGHRSPTTKPSPQKKLFETEHLPLFDKPQGE